MPEMVQDWDTFDKRHRHDVIVRWPAQSPTNGRHDHRAESIRLFKTFPDNRVHNRPYKTLFASGDWTCSIARFTGTMKGPMAGPNGGATFPPTGKSLRGRFLHRCPVERRWRNHRGEPLLRFSWPDAPSRNWLIPGSEGASWPNSNGSKTLSSAAEGRRDLVRHIARSSLQACPCGAGVDLWFLSQCQLIAQ